MKITNYAIKSGLVAGIVFGAALAASAVNVTFQVNMSVQTALGQFNSAGGDYVVVSGDFNSWSLNAFPLTQSATNADIWQGTVDLAAGSYPNYKFVIEPEAIWEINGVGTGGSQNRWFGVGTTDEVLDVVYFNNQTNVPSNTKLVTFQVDMSIQTATGTFDPVNGPLVVSGVFNNWNTTAAPLAPSAGNTNIWVGTVNITADSGTWLDYKFVMNGNVWESSADRSFQMTNGPQTLPVVFFSNISALPVPIPLNFSVNMGVQQALGNFNPTNGDYVEAEGSFNVSGGGTWLGGFALTNDPVNNPLVYSGTFVDPNDNIGSLVTYAFVMHSSTTTWEANRTITLTSTNATALPLAYFNNVNNLGPLFLSKSGSQMVLIWPAGTNVNNTISLQSSTNLSHGWTAVPNSWGQTGVTNDFGAGTMFFRLIGP